MVEVYCFRVCIYVDRTFFSVPPGAILKRFLVVRQSLFVCLFATNDEVDRHCFENKKLVNHKTEN